MRQLAVERATERRRRLQRNSQTMKGTSMKRQRPRVVVALLVLLSACGGVSPKVTIDRADRAAFTSVRGFQLAEEQQWHARAAWPTAEQHRAVNVKVSQAYQLIIDTASLGIALPPGSKLSAADLAAVIRLEQVVTDIVALARSAPTNVQQAATAAQSKVGVLVSAVKGGA